MAAAPLTQAQITQILQNLGSPGLQATLVGVRREAARLGVPAPSREDIARVVRTAGEHQVFRPTKSGEAAVYALERDQLWQCDVGSLEVYQNIKKNLGYNFSCCTRTSSVGPFWWRPWSGN